ncbi:unnamed protein product [Polarella glacialis]|uniref:Uncharacterized protein n=1 Tax=Polarella glacialis TaxID=89957 RepID=A0A813GME2_POLGL|nr:unnamed protein product [Polarella glacialis]
MKSVQALLQRMQADLSELTASTGQIAAEHAAVRAELQSTSQGIDDLLGERLEAREALTEAREEVESSRHELLAAADGVRCGLSSQPAPLLRAPAGGSLCGEAACAVVATLKDWLWLHTHLLVFR